MCCPLSTSSPVSRSVNAVARPPSRAFASRTSTRAPRFVSRAAALSPANPAPTTMTSGAVSAIASIPQPLLEGDQRLPRLGHPHAFGEHVVASLLDPLQRLEVDGAHDLGRHEPLPIVWRPCVDRLLIEPPRPPAFELEQPPHGLGDDAGREVVD